MTNVKELEKFVNEVFDKDLEDVDSGWDYDYIMASRAYSKATSEQERLEQKALMDKSAAEMIYRYNLLVMTMLKSLTRSIREISYLRALLRTLWIKNF